MTRFEEPLIADFNRWYYQSGQWGTTTYLGHTIWKSVADLWVYQEIIYNTRPDLIIEMGTAFGGSALYMAHLMERVWNATHYWSIVSVDINPEHARNAPPHDRIRYLTGDSSDPQIIETVRAGAEHFNRVMVVLDSAHNEEHVLKELRAYADLVTPGCYLIVEDTNVNGNPVFPEHGPGPAEAIAEWGSEGFEVDPDRTRFGLTFNPSGYLRRL